MNLLLHFRFHWNLLLIIELFQPISVYHMMINYLIQQTFQSLTQACFFPIPQGYQCAFGLFPVNRMSFQMIGEWYTEWSTKLTTSDGAHLFLFVALNVLYLFLFFTDY